MKFTIKNLFYHHSHIGDTLECAFENALHLLPDRKCIKEHLAKFTNFCTTCGNVWNSSKNTKQNSKKQMFQSEKLLFSVLRHLALFHEYHLKRFQIYSLCTRFHKYKKLSGYQRGKNPPDDAIKTLENDFINGRCQCLLQIIYLDSFCQRLLKEAQRRQHVVQE